MGRASSHFYRQNPKERELWFLLARMGKRRSHWAAESFFCPVEVPSSPGGTSYPLFALLPLAGILLLPWNLWAGGSVILLRFGVELGALLSGQKAASKGI